MASLRGAAKAEGWNAALAAAIRHYSHLHPEGEAASLAWAALVNRWHRRHGEKVAEWTCAGCCAPTGEREALALADGNRVHLDTLDCLIRYGRRWRGAATRALVAMGLAPPSDNRSTP